MSMMWVQMTIEGFSWLDAIAQKYATDYTLPGYFLVKNTSLSISSKNPIIVIEWL